MSDNSEVVTGSDQSPAALGILFDSQMTLVFLKSVTHDKNMSIDPDNWKPMIDRYRGAWEKRNEFPDAKTLVHRYVAETTGEGIVGACARMVLAIEDPKSDMRAELMKFGDDRYKGLKVNFDDDAQLESMRGAIAQLAPVELTMPTREV